MRRKIAELIEIVFGFRKFILMILLFLVGIVFRIKSLLSGSEFVDLLKSTTISFFAANGVEHLMSTVKEYVNSKNTQSKQIDVDSDSIADTDESNDNKEVEVK